MENSSNTRGSAQSIPFPDLQLKKLEADLKKAKDIAELGAQAIGSQHISMLFNSQNNLSTLLTGNPILSEIFKNVQQLVHYSLKQKEENSNLIDHIAVLVEKAVDDEKTEKNTITELCNSMSLLENENNGLNETIKHLEKNNCEQQQRMTNLNAKFEAATAEIEKLKNFEEECQTKNMTVKNLQNIKNYLEGEALKAVTEGEKAKLKNEKLEHFVVTLSRDKEKLEQHVAKILNEIEKLKINNEFLQSACRSAEEKIHRISHSERSLKYQNEILQKSLNQSDNDIKQIEDEKERLCANEDRLKKYVAEIGKNFKCQKDENAYLRNSLSNYGQKVASLEKNIEELKEAVKTKGNLSTANAQNSDQVNSLKKNNMHLTAEINTLKKTAENLEIRNERQAGELKRFWKSREALTMFLKKTRIEARNDSHATVTSSTKSCSNVAT